MKRAMLVIIVLLSIGNLKAQQSKSVAEQLEWWKDARFGMFIHWGPVSIKGTEIGWSRGSEIPIAEYDALYKQFNPVKFNAEEWVKLAKDAGMKYIVFTSKHHDGFCMWDTKFSDHNIMNSPFHRDVMKELAEACKRQGMALGFYHSTCDWYNPDFPLTSPGGSVRRESSNLERYTEYLKNQSVEIIKNYGPLLVMWYDVPQEFDAVRGQGVIDYIRTIQPDILVNDRTGAKGDFDTPEQRIGTFQNNRPWETCMTIGRQWAYKPDEEVKSLEQCLHNLIRSAGGDGNLLFNVGPRPDGVIEPLQADRLREMGKWLNQNGYSIYGTRGGPFKPSDWGVSTRKGNKVYLHILKWSGKSPKITVPDVGIQIKSIAVKPSGNAKFTQVNGSYIIEFSSGLLQPLSTIVEIEYSADVMNVMPVDVVPQSVSYMKPVNASSNLKAGWINHQWTDIKAVNNGEWSGSYWQPSSDDKTPWIEIDLGKNEKFSKAKVYEGGGNIKSYELQYKSGEEWKTFYRERTIKSGDEIKFSEINTREIRFLITSYTSTPEIYEIMLLKD